MWLRAQTVDCNSDYRKQIVSAYIIENPGEVEERFSYEVQFNSATWLSLVAYSQANYGLEAVFRLMTEAEKADFIAPGKASIGRNCRLTRVRTESEACCHQRWLHIT